jgi:hypothetical protein
MWQHPDIMAVHITSGLLHVGRETPREQVAILPLTLKSRSKQEIFQLLPVWNLRDLQQDAASDPFSEASCHHNEPTCALLVWEVHEECRSFGEQ